MACALGDLEGNYYITTNLFEYNGRQIDVEPLGNDTTQTVSVYNYPNKHNKMVHWSKFVDLDDYFSFGFVRNPKQRLVALYLQQLRGFGLDDTQDSKGHFLPVDEELHKSTNLPIGRHEFTFDFFVRTFVPSCGSNQVVQFCDCDQNMLANFVGRFENLDEDWKKVCDHLGVGYLPLPRKRVSSDYNIDDFFTSDLLEFLFDCDFYSMEYEVFRYEKG
jgi:hypothetical protein